MKILLIGYGKMGRAIEQAAVGRGHSISGRISSANRSELPALLKEADVAIEFTRPDICVGNIRACFEAGVPVVVGTTGWYEHYEAISRECREKGNALLAATNFSLGVNIFFAMNSWLARVMNHQEGYQASVEEIHHTQKLDAPSGTAITLAQGILEHTLGLNSWQVYMNEMPARREQGKLPIVSIRKDEVPGTHTVSYRSAIDDIEIRHTAHNRAGFALGSVIAAEFVHGKKGVFTMQDVLQF